MIALPVAVEPREHDLPDGGMFGQPRPDVAAARDHGQQAVGQFLVDDPGQGQDGQRGVFGGLDHHGVAHAQGGGDLPDGDHHGPVPGADRAHDADGPVVQFGVGFAVVHHSFRIERRGGGSAKPGGAGTDFEAGVGAVERLALLAGEEPGEFFGGAFDGVGCFHERSGPGVVAQGSPGGLRGSGGGDGGFEVLDRVNTCFSDSLARCRVKNGAAVLAVGRRD